MCAFTAECTIWKNKLIITNIQFFTKLLFKLLQDICCAKLGLCILFHFTYTSPKVTSQVYTIFRVTYGFGFESGCRWFPLATNDRTKMSFTFTGLQEYSYVKASYGRINLKHGELIGVYSIICFRYINCVHIELFRPNINILLIYETQ